MIFQLVFIFLLSWQSIGCEGIENFSIESVLDQIAIPTKIIDAFLQKPAKKYPSNGQQIESTTIHYENSNGFVPLIVSTQPYLYRQKKINTTRLVSENIEKKIPSHLGDQSSHFLPETTNSLNQDQNRRSFHTDDRRDEFELLKVNNGTPAVANYRTFYDHSKDAIKSDHTRTETNLKKSFKSKDRERSNRIQAYTHNYQVLNNDNRPYLPLEVDQEHTKSISNSDKSSKNYKQDNIGNYRTEKPKPKSNYVTIVTPKSTVDIHISNKEKNEQHRFKSPIVIEPSAYQVDMKLNGPQVQSAILTSTEQTDIKTESSQVNTRSEKRKKALDSEDIQRMYDYADSRDFSTENGDYEDKIEKPRRIQKSSRRRPYHFDSSKTLPKEHRETYDDYDDERNKKRQSLKSKFRNKPKPTPIIHDYDQYDNEDDISDNNSSKNPQKFNAWSQVGPNIEVSHSTGFEINQVEKPKLHIVPVNIVSNFDHATAIDSSQGFDISNAMFTGFVHEGALSTASPLVSSPSNFIKQNIIQSSSSKPSVGLSTSVPDVIVGQNSYQNSVRAVLMPNQLQQNILNQYAQSTTAPAVFAVTPNPSYLASTMAPNFEQMIKEAQISYVNSQQYDSTQSNHQNSDRGSSYGQRGRHSYKTTPSTTTKSYFERTSSSQKKKYDHNNGQFLASASLSVDHGTHRNSHNRNSKRNRNNQKKNNNDNYNHNYNHYNNNYDNNNEPNYDDQNSNQQTKQNGNINNFVQPTIVPAILHTGIGLINNQNQQLIPNSFIIANPQQNSQMFKITGIGNTDNIGGSSNNVNAINNLINPVQKAQLPPLGAKNVEIMNPNMNANGNAFAINSIPAALVTTPIPIFTTTGIIASKQFSSTTQDPLNPGRTMYNPINFIPNIDLMRSQSVLNTNVIPSEQFSQNLNLVPIVHGGNFYRHSQGGQHDLSSKPKLSSDLEKYAEEMFKESLRTIYNSQKWNHDIRYPGNISLVDDSELARLRNELLRMRSNVKDSKVPKDVVEGHQTENKIRTAKPSSDYKRPVDSSIEQPYKHKSHGHHHTRHHKQKPEINDYLTPPKLNSFTSKSPFHEKPPKKRPGHGSRLNLNHENPRLRPKQGAVALKPIGQDAVASSVIDYRYPVRPHPVKSHYGPPDYRRSQVYNYPTFTTAFPENDKFRASVELKSSEKEFFDMNNQRAHNLMGLLMKNKQLPPGIQRNRYSDKDTVGHYFDEENNRAQTQAYKDAMGSFQKKSDYVNRMRPTASTKVLEKRY